MSMKAGSTAANILPPMLITTSGGLIYSFGTGSIITFFGFMFVIILYFIDLNAERSKSPFLILNSDE
jgi:hypothetical protein